MIILAGWPALGGRRVQHGRRRVTSVAAQAEHAEAEIAVEREELLRNPPASRQRSPTCTSSGLDPELALRRSPANCTGSVDRRSTCPRRTRVTLASALASRLAALSSFLSFAAGALVPVLPYLAGATALWPAAVLALLGLFVCGSVVTTLTSRSWWYGGLRQLVLGAAAAALTYAFGNAVGTGLG